MKRIVFLLSVLLVIAGASSASAQYGGYDSPIAQALDDIAWEIRMTRYSLDSDYSLGTSYGGYGGGIGVFPVYQKPPTKKQWKHFYRAEHAAAVRAGTAKAIRTTVVKRW